jgi:DNA-binding NarL/FixJ family response regulator
VDCTVKRRPAKEVCATSHFGPKEPAAAQGKFPYHHPKSGKTPAGVDHDREREATEMNMESVLVGAEPAPPVPAGSGSRLSLMLVDDHAILREGLRALIELEPDFHVVGEAASVDEAVAMAARLQPDIVLTDIGLPGRSGLALVRELRGVCPAVRVVLLTAHASEEYIRAGLDCSADGYVLKDSGHAELMTAIRTVATGQQFLCKAVAGRVLASYLNRDERAVQSPLQSITARERQVLTRIASGQSNKVVARELNLSVKTVEKHRANLMRKLELHNAAGIARFALNHRLIATDGTDLPDGLPGALAS